MTLIKTLLLSATVLTSTMSVTFATNIKDVVATAIQTNPEVLIAKRNKDAIEQELRQAKAGYLPTVDLTIGSGHERSNNSTTRSRSERADNTGGHRSLWRNEARLLVNQMVFDGFQVSNNVKQQQARLNSAVKNTQEIKESVSLKAVQAYLDVLRNQELLNLSEENVASHKRYLKQIDARSSSGRGSKADIRQAEGRLALAESTLISAKGELKNSISTYERVVGEKPVDLQKYSTPKDLLPATREDAVATALDYNPAIHSAQYDVETSNKAYQATKAAFYPQLDLELEAQRQHNLDGTDEANNAYLAMARVRYNLYNGGADLARKRERSARMEEAKDTLERDRREVEERMHEAWSNYETVKMRLKPLSSHLKASSETKKAYKSQFDIGQRSLLDLLDTEVEYFNANTAYINGQYAADFAVFNVLANNGSILQVFNK